VEDSGGTDFFEDLQALIVVVLGIGIFLASSAYSYVSFQNFQRDLRNQREAFAFLSDFLSYGPLLVEGQQGLLDARKIAGITTEDIIRDLGPPLPFRILIHDTSIEHAVEDMEWSSGVMGGEYHVATTSGVLQLDYNDVHPVRVTAFVGEGS